MKKIVIVTAFIIALIFSVSNVAFATDIIDLEDDGFSTIENSTSTTATETNNTTTETTNTTTTNTAETSNTSNTSTTGTATATQDSSVAKTSNPQTGIKEQAPIMILVLIGICVAVYAGNKTKKYNY